MKNVVNAYMIDTAAAFYAEAAKALGAEIADADALGAALAGKGSVDFVGTGALARADADEFAKITAAVDAAKAADAGLVVTFDGK